MQKILEQLENIVGKENVLADHASRLAYSRQCGYNPKPKEFLPLAIVRPVHKSQLTRLLSYCSTQKIPIVFRGTGCMWDGISTPLLPDSIVILSTGLNKINIIDKYTISVEAGASISSVQSACIKSGLFCPFMAPEQAPYTIGGILAINQAGSDINIIGTLASYIVSLEVYSTDGRSLKSNAASGLGASFDCGFPVPAIFCGSKGGLAFISECEFRVWPAHYSFYNMAFSCKDLQSALDIADRCMDYSSLYSPILQIFDPAASDVICSGLDEVWVISIQYLNGAENLLNGLEQAILENIRVKKLAKDAMLYQSIGKLPTLLVQKYGFFRYGTYHCKAVNFSRFLNAILDTAKQFGKKIMVWGLPAVGKINVASFDINTDDDSFEKKLLELELIFNNCVKSSFEMNSERVSVQESLAKNLMQAAATIFDPSNLLAAQRSAWDCK